MRIRNLIVLGLALSMAASAARAAATPASPASSGSIESVTFEISPAEATVRIGTSRPVPPYTCELQEGGEVVVRFTSVTGRLEAAYPAPVSYLGPIIVETSPGGGAGAVTVRINPRATSLARLETRPDGIALMFPASTDKAEAAAKDYQVGVGDRLEIAVYGHEDLTKTTEVRSDGSINLPLLGDMQVLGKGVRTIADELAQRLGSEFLVDPKVSVEVREYRSHWVTLMGEVRTPGRYPLRRNMRLLDVLAEAGGPTKDAGRQIRVTTPSGSEAAPQVQVIQMQDLLRAGDAGANLALHHGDVITVMDRELFYIRGEINRPSAYVLEEGMTLVKAIAIAGGLTPYASHKDIQVLRSSGGPGGSGGQERIVLNLKSIEDGKREDLALQADDVIIVPRRIF